MKRYCLLLKRKMGAWGSPAGFYGTGDLTLSCRKGSGRVFLANLWRNNEKIIIKFLPASVNSSLGILNPPSWNCLTECVLSNSCSMQVVLMFGQKKNKFVTHQACTFSLACVFPISRNNAIEELLRSPAANSNMAADKLHGLPPRWSRLHTISFSREGVKIKNSNANWNFSILD